MVYKATNGDLYLRADKIGSTNSSNNIHVVYKSTDNGSTWTADSAGLTAAKVGMSKFFVDESGVQYAMGFENMGGSGNFLRVWRKPVGGNWARDTAGLGNMNTFYSDQCFGSGNNGKIYVAIMNLNTGFTTIYSHPLGGGTWAMETSVSGFVFDIKGNAGKVVVGTEYGVSYNTGGGWQNAATLPGFSTNDFPVVATEVGSNGITWAAYSTYDPDFGEIGRGVFYTTDFITWQPVSPQVDTIVMGSLNAIGDSVFALTAYWDGVYVFDTAAGLTTAAVALKNEMNASFYPNPFSDEARLSFDLDQSCEVQLSIYNALGQRVFSSARRMYQQGMQTIDIDLSGTSRGMLYYELQAGDKRANGKVIGY